MRYFVPLLVLLAGCASLVGKFDQNSYSSAKELKEQADRLFLYATEPATSHLEELISLQSKLDFEATYEQNKPQNLISGSSWKLMADPSGHMLGGFLAKWKAGASFHKAYVNDVQTRVDLEFNKLAGWEASKPR